MAPSTKVVVAVGCVVMVMAGGMYAGMVIVSRLLTLPEASCAAMYIVCVPAAREDNVMVCSAAARLVAFVPAVASEDAVGVVPSSCQ